MMKVLAQCVLTSPVINANGRLLSRGALERAFRDLGDRTLPVLSAPHHGFECGRLVSWGADPVSGRIEGLLLIDDSDSLAKRVLAGELCAVSLGYGIWESHYQGQVQVVDRLELYEVSLNTIGANPDAVIRKVQIV